MVEIVRMPGILAGAESGIINRWLVDENDELEIGQVVAEIETDKASVEINAEVAGVVGRRLVAEGDEVEVGAPILALVAAGETAEDIEKALHSKGSDVTQPPPGEEPSESAADEDPRGQMPGAPEDQISEEAEEPEEPQTKQRIFASPIVRRLAKEHGVDPSNMEGTGPGGRIVRRDLERYLDAAARSESATPVHAPAPVESPVAQSVATSDSEAAFVDEPLSPMRKTIARRLTESKATAPHFYLSADCRVSELIALREQINTSGTRRVSINDLVLKAVGQAHTQIPAANAVWNEDSIRRFSSVDVAVAVAIEDGLVTPVIRDIERMSITTLSETAADLAERARSGGLKQHELEGGSFTVSNLGMYGTKEFSAILNPPQAGILAVGAARSAPVVTEDDELGVEKIMTVTLSADHRVLDGAIAAQWLAAFQQVIENPIGILL